MYRLFSGHKHHEIPEMSGAKVYFKGLNGLRAIAAISVVLSHIVLSAHHFGFRKKENIEFANFSVTIFFALSGFLITYLLLSEKEKFRHVSLRKFYIRRILRIWPLYFLYLGLALAATMIWSPEILPGSIAWYFFLGANVPFILGTGIPLVLHYWSLGVEEQFYLFWPVLVRNSTNVFRGVGFFLIGFLVLKIIFRIIHSETGYVIPYMILDVTRFDCMAIGALGAILFFRKSRLFLKTCFSVPLQLLAWASLVLVAFDRFHIASLFDHEILAGLIVVLMVNVSSNQRTLVRLDYKVFDFLGKISYGIYVLHPLVIFLLAKYLGARLAVLPVWIQAAILVLIVLGITIGLALLSYQFFEKPFLRLKEKFAIVPSSPEVIRPDAERSGAKK